jgi:uncharacterized protein (DUF1800 family)
MLNLDLLPGEKANAFSSDGQDSTGAIFPFTVESVDPVPGFEAIQMVTIRLDNVGDVGDVLLRVSLHGVASNRVRVGIGHIGGGPADDVGAVPTPAPQVAPSPTPTPTPISYSGPSSSDSDTTRLLEQASWGPTASEISRVKGMGFQAYLNEQFNMPLSSYPNYDLYPTDSTVGCPTGTAPANCTRDNYSMYKPQLRFFLNALSGQDQLRQRVSFALHEIIPVSGTDLNNQPGWVGPYLQTLDRDAFGNFRQLLLDITLNPGMGDYLDMRGNSKTAPNENYAREILQLFSVGVDALNQDGTPILDAQGNRVPTYDQNTITEFARVFTGWNLAANKTWAVNGTTLVPNYTDPMVLQANTNTYDTAAKTLLNGQVLPAIAQGQNAQTYKTAELNAALDNIFNHPNTGVYIGREMIRKLVTSNPSPAYVGRVAAAFANNGAGVRGDMKAVITAILLDPEARGDIKTDPNYGHLREPALLITSVLRAFNATSDGFFRDTINAMGQNLFSPPTVFSYFPADYQIPGTNTLYGPEYGIMSSSTTLKRANFLNTLIISGVAASQPNAPTGTQLNFSGLQTLAGNPQQLVDAMDALLMHGSMQATMKNTIVQTVTNVSSANSMLRTQTAAYLITSSSQFQVQR